jgi:tetratricopeptide (TPR) repeat protein
MLLRVLIFFFCLLPGTLLAQKNITDSLYRLLEKEKIDTNRINLMVDIGYELRGNDPEKALNITNEAISLSKSIKYANGYSRGLGTIAIIFNKVGNYPRALEFSLQRLKLVEKMNDQEKFANVLINIGIVYVYQEEYKKALTYYYKADSVIEQYNIKSSKYSIALNMGDVYDKLNNTDSAYSYFNKSLTIAMQLKNNYRIAKSMVGLGHSYLKSNNYTLALANYNSSNVYLKESHDDDDLLCELTLGLAKLYKKINQNDSALVYAKQSLDTAEKCGFIPRQLEAVKFLATWYKDKKNIDSSFYYLNYVQNLNDTINSKSRIRESQILSSNEQLRQLEIVENIRVAKRERKQQLQLLFIAIFIPGFFLLTLLLSRIKLHVRIIKILGILSLLILFEYLTLLLHPYVVELTNHTPVIEMLIFVSIAAVIIPAHHRVENLLIRWLTKNRPLFAGNKLKMKTNKIIKKTI